MTQNIVIYGPDQIIRYVIAWDGVTPIRTAPDEQWSVAGDAPVAVGWTWHGDYAEAPPSTNHPCRATLLRYGRLSGTIYDFVSAGDVLPKHTHGDSDVHISVVARGSFHCYGDRGDMTITAGDVIDWNPGEFHGFTALEDNSRLVNIIKG